MAQHIGQLIESELGWDIDLWRTPGTKLMKFGETVRAWVANGAKARPGGSGGAYYGGWPSANLATMGFDGVVSSSLLIEDSVVGKDLISDWFTTEQYYWPHIMGSRPGWLTDEQTPNVAATRCFLSTQIPHLRRLLPLLDAGIVRLVPSELASFQNQNEIETLVEMLRLSLGDPMNVARAFTASQIPTADNRRGQFLVTGGDPEPHALRNLEHGLRYFTAEFSLAQRVNSTYTAVYDWEHRLCRQLPTAMSPTLSAGQVLTFSGMPMFWGLSPEKIREIHEDDKFGQFRADLREIYSGCPTSASPEEVRLYARQRERETLDPLVRDIEESLATGVWRRMAIGVKEAKYSLAAGGLGGMVTGALDSQAGRAAIAGGTAVASLVQIAESVRRQQSKGGPIWKSLLAHGQKVDEELSLDTPLESRVSTEDHGLPWGLGGEPSMSVTVTDGTAIMDWFSPSPATPEDFPGYSEGDYRPCDCGSRRRYRFCCKGVDRFAPGWGSK